MQDIEVKKIIVTGAAGFIGFHCLKVLSKRNYEIHAIRRSNNSISNSDNVIWHTLDLFDLDSLESLIKKIKPTYLLHLAWKVETGLNLESDENEKWFELSKSVIKLFYKYGGRRLLVSGSCFEYEMNNDLELKETSSLKAKNSYGKNKNKLFHFLKNFDGSQDISYVWARIFFTFGPNQKKTSLLPYVISSLKNNDIVSTTDGNQEYDYLFVEDVAMALILLLESNYIGDVNVCSGRGIKLKTLISSIAKYFDKEHLIKFGAKPRPLNSPGYIVGSNKILKNVTNWGEKFSLQEAIKNTINNFK